MNTFLWVMFGLYVSDIIFRCVSFSTQRIPERTWGTYSIDAGINVALLCWIVYLLGAR